MSDRFQASIKRGHQVTLSNVMGRLQSGSIFSLTPQEYIDLSDLAGALNYWAAQAPMPPDNVTTHDEVMRGDGERHVFTAAPGMIDVFPFSIPGPPYASATAPEFKVAVAEFQGGTFLRRTSLSTIKGDMNGPITSQGTVTTLYVVAGVDFPVGALVYANTEILVQPPPGDGRSAFSIVWP